MFGVRWVAVTAAGAGGKRWTLAVTVLPWPRVPTGPGGDTAAGVTQACGGISWVTGTSALSCPSATFSLATVRKASGNLRMNHCAAERTEDGKGSPPEAHSPSSGVEHSGGPGAGSPPPSSPGLSLSSRGPPCWKGPRMSGSTEEWSTKADASHTTYEPTTETKASDPR